MKYCLGHHLSTKPFCNLLSFTHRPDLTIVAKPGLQELSRLHPDTSDNVLAAESLPFHACPFKSLQVTSSSSELTSGFSLRSLQVGRWWDFLSLPSVYRASLLPTSGSGHQRNTPTLPCIGSSPCGIVSQSVAS